MSDPFDRDPSDKDPSLPTNVQVRDQLRALGYRCSLAFPGNMDINGRQYLLSNAEFRALALSRGPHPLDLEQHSVKSSHGNRTFTFPPPPDTEAD